MTVLEGLHGMQIQVASPDQSVQPLDDFLASVERRAFRMAEIATGNADDALDIVQDAMLNLARKYAGKDPDDWPPLFFRILQSRINDFHRRQKTRRGLFSFFRKDSGEDEHHDPIQLAEDEDGIIPDRLLDSDELGEALDQALKALPQRQQQTFMLRVWEGLNVAETAYALSISEGSVKTHLARANASLRQSLAGFRDEPTG